MRKTLGQQTASAAMHGGRTRTTHTDASAEHESVAAASSWAGVPFGSHGRSNATAKGTVGSSSDPLVPLLDVRRVSTDDLDLFSPALAGLRDGLSRPCPLLDELREDRDESSHYRKKYRDDVEDASHYLKDSLHYLKEASHRRFRPKSARKRLLHRLQDDLAHVEGERASRFRLVAVVSRAKSDVKEVLQHRSGAKSSRSKSREHRDCFLQYV
jgi:hypothetical protein